jgi:hypothetical protein
MPIETQLHHPVRILSLERLRRTTAELSVNGKSPFASPEPDLPLRRLGPRFADRLYQDSASTARALGREFQAVHLLGRPQSDGNNVTLHFVPSPSQA